MSSNTGGKPGLNSTQKAISPSKILSYGAASPLKSPMKRFGLGATGGNNFISKGIITSEIGGGATVGH